MNTTSTRAVSTTALVFATLLAAVGCASERPSKALPAAARDEGPSVLRATTTSPMYPEGVAYDAKSNSFFVGSVREGTIGRIDAHGRYTTFADAPELVSSAGLFVDGARRRLLVAVGDVGVAARSAASTRDRLARVVEIDLDTAKVLRVTDFQTLAGLGATEHLFANDVTADAAGNVYATDSAASIVYRVDVAGHASIFARSPLFGPPPDARPGFPHLNGVVAHPHGFLLVGHWSKGQILKVPLVDPSHPKIVAEGVFGADGLVLASERELVVVRNYVDHASAGNEPRVTGSATVLTSSDDWETTQVIARGTGDAISVPTTAALRGQDVWALNFPYDEFFANPKSASRREIVLSRLHFEPTNEQSTLDSSRSAR